MYFCRLRVRHISSKGANYMRWHVVEVRTTLRQAVEHIGGVPPHNETECLSIDTLHYPEIQYTNNALATSVDPKHIIVHLSGLQGGVFIDVPYQCSFKHLIENVIPQKLVQIGVHKYYVNGTLQNLDGSCATVKNVWNSAQTPHFVWAKLKVPVAYKWPNKVLTGIARFQKLLKARHDEWIVVNNKDFV